MLKKILCLIMMIVVAVFFMPVIGIATANGSDPVEVDPVEVDLVEVVDDGIGNLPFNCDTDWERATLEQCEGLPYKVFTNK